MTYQQVLAIINQNLTPNTQITALEHQEIEKALLDFSNRQWLTGDIKKIDCIGSYISENFEPNGKGKNERVGWAICNGENGTKNRVGRVSVGFGFTSGSSSVPTFTTVGATGGSANAVVVEHQHRIAQNGFAMTSESQAIGNGGTVGIKTGTNTTFGYIGPTKPTGENATNKNLQPYIVTLYIQKIDLSITDDGL